MKRCIRSSDNWGIYEEAAASLRRLEGPDSLEPDYVFVCSQMGSPEDNTIQRLRERGDATRLLEVVADPGCDDEVAAPLLLALAERKPMPIDAAVAMLDDNRPGAPAVAGWLLGRAPKLKKAATTKLVKALDAALAHWHEQRKRQEDLEEATFAVTWLIWACAKHNVGGEQLATALTLVEKEAASIREAAIIALSLQPNPEVLEGALANADAAIRTTAADTLVRAAPERAKSVSLDDRGSAERVLQGGVSPPGLAAAARQVHTQGIVLPHLVKRKETKTLIDALASKEEGVLHGAIEALGALGETKAEDKLRDFAIDEAHDEELRKAAWRALRRSKRARAGKEAR
ncbi:MAG: hypothetical protein HN348_34250 [Proteobacteria bacterium]|nr:hypothetical protein [Pseudomonadota bacterium]